HQPTRPPGGPPRGGGATRPYPARTRPLPRVPCPALHRRRVRNLRFANLLPATPRGDPAAPVDFGLRSGVAAAGGGGRAGLAGPGAVASRRQGTRAGAGRTGRALESARPPQTPVPRPAPRPPHQANAHPAAAT